MKSPKYNSILVDVFLSYIYKVFFRKVSKRLQERYKFFALFLNDSVSESIQVQGLYEKEYLIPLFKILTNRFVLSNQVSIDAGANIGNHSLFFADIFSEVYSFEPNPITFKLLEVNTFTSKTIKVFNVGLSDENSKKKISVLPSNLGASSITYDHKNNLYFNVILKKLDEIEELNYKKIGLLKVDVEGMEVNVIRGAIRIIKENLPIILLEYFQGDDSIKFEQIQSLLREYGYKIYLLRESHYSKVKILRRIKRLFLVLTNGSLKYYLKQTEDIPKGYYPMLIAISENSNFVFKK